MSDLYNPLFKNNKIPENHKICASEEQRSPISGSKMIEAEVNGIPIMVNLQDRVALPVKEENINS